MVPMGDHVDEALAVWKGEMNAKVAAIDEVKGMVKDLQEELGEVADKVTVLTTKASVYAVLGGLVGSGVVGLLESRPRQGRQSPTSVPRKASGPPKDGPDGA